MYLIPSEMKYEIGFSLEWSILAFKAKRRISSYYLLASYDRIDAGDRFAEIPYYVNLKKINIIYLFTHVYVY